MEKLLNEATAFAWRVLRYSVSPLLWWALLGLLIAGINLLLLNELWPNTPSAKGFFGTLACSCGMLAGWAIPVTVHAIYKSVRGILWQLLWWLLWVGSIFGAIGLVLLCGISFVISFMAWADPIVVL